MAILSLAVVVILGEFTARIVPTEFSSPGPRYTYNPKVGSMLLPNQRFDIIGSCFSARNISINAHGFRDEEHSFEKERPRIAIIGDSFVAAFQVEDQKTFYSLLGEEFPEWEFLAFGRSGFGTAQEFLVYEEYVRRFSPDIVILMFLAANDLVDNSETLKRTLERRGERRPFLRMGEAGVEIYFPETTRPPSPKPGALRSIRSFLHRNSALYRLAKGTLKRAQTKFSGKERARIMQSLPRGAGENHRIVGRHFGWNVYIPPESNHPEWARAWEATEALLLKFAQRVRERGSRFILVHIEERPLFVANDGDLRELRELNPDFDLYYPANRLRQFSERHGIEYVEFNALMLRYAKMHELNDPPFSFRCDGHWSDQGHRAAAAHLSSHLRGIFTEGPETGALSRAGHR